MVQDFSRYSEEQIGNLVGSINDKIKNKRNDFTLEEKQFMQEHQKNQENQNTLPLSPESHENEERFNRVRGKASFEINHITDLHATPKDFEGRLINELDSKGHIERDEKGQFKGVKKRVAVALTGDIGSDFFDQSRTGVEAFLTKEIFKKAGFSDSEKKEFSGSYNELMKLAGLTEEMITERSPALSSQQNNPLEKFMGFLYGIQDPSFLSNEQKAEFRQTQKKVQDMLKQGMYHHAKKEYGEIKNILKKYNLTPDNLVMVGGNHDVHSVLEEILGDYVVRPGETRDVAGIKFGNIVRSANGNFTQGPDFDEVFGYAGLREQLEKDKTASKPFQDILYKLNESGSMNISEKELKKYVEVSMQRAAMGIGRGDLGKYIKKHTEKLLELKLKQGLDRVKLPKNADVILNHSVIDDPQRAGLEEFYAHTLMSDNKDYMGALVLGGHEHSPTPHRKDGIYHINPGSITAGNSAIHLLDDNKKYSSSLFESLGPNSERVYKHMLKDEIPGQTSGRSKG